MWILEFFFSESLWLLWANIVVWPKVFNRCAAVNIIAGHGERKNRNELLSSRKVQCFFFVFVFSFLEAYSDQCRKTFGWKYRRFVCYRCSGVYKIISYRWDKGGPKGRRGWLRMGRIDYDIRRRRSLIYWHCYATPASAGVEPRGSRNRGMKNGRSRKKKPNRRWASVLLSYTPHLAG